MTKKTPGEVKIPNTHAPHLKVGKQEYFLTFTDNLVMKPANRKQLSLEYFVGCGLSSGQCLLFIRCQTASAC